MADPVEPYVPELPDDPDALVNVTHPVHGGATIPRGKLHTLGKGWRLEAVEETQHRDLQKKHGDSALKAFGEGVVRGAAPIVGDLALQAAGIDPEATRSRAEFNPLASGTGGLVGAVALPGVGTVASKGAAAVARTAKLGRLAEGGILARAAAKAIPAGVEGAIIGTAQAASELPLSDDPLTAERVASQLATGALLGGGAGLVLGGAGSLLADGARAARGLAGRAAARSEIAATKATVADDVTDLAGKSRKELRLIEDAELKTLEEGRVASRTQAADDIVTHRTEWVKSRPWEAFPEGSAERAALKRSDNILRRLTDNPKGLARAPQRALDALETQERVLLKLDEAAERMPLGMPLGAQDAARAALQRTQTLQTRIADLQAAPTSARLTATRDAIAGAGQQAGGAGLGLGDVVSGAVIAQQLGVPPEWVAAGAVALKFGSKLGKLRESMAKSTSAAAKGVQKGLDAFVRGTEKVAKVAPRTSAAVLSSTSYGSAPKALAKHAKDDVNAFRARTAELAQAVEFGPDGLPRASMATRRKINESLSGVFAIAPQLADKMESAAVRRIEYLANAMPKNPGLSIMGGPDRWTPDGTTRRSFARTMDIVENGLAAFMQHLLSGKLRPQDVEALREVWPESFAEIQRGLIERLAELRETLPRQKRFMLSILFDVPVDPAMRPEMIQAFQANFARAQEQQPAPQGNPGALGKKSAPTPTAAQQLADK